MKRGTTVSAALILLVVLLVATIASAGRASADAFTVTIQSPNSGSVFNRGQTVTVTASVSLDGKPVSGALVMANSPSGPTFTLLETSKPGTYSAKSAILATDPVGAWTILVNAVKSGNSGSASLTVTIVSLLQVQVSTFSSSTFNSPQDTFLRGQMVFVKGIVSYQDGGTISSGTVSFTISGTSVASAPVTMTFSSPLNAWTGSYTLLSSDQAGSQNVAASASFSGNSGSGQHQITIQGAPGGQVLAVTITSPTSGSVFNRGGAVTISALVTSTGTAVTGATVIANNPTGGAITLSGSGGTYSALYTVLPTDPIGTWTISVQATKGSQSGSSQVATVISATLNVVVSTWSSSSFTVPQDSFVRGDTVFVKTVVQRQDGSTVSSGTVSFEITGTTVANAAVQMVFNPSLGAWTGFYTLLHSDGTATQTVRATATDTTGNSGSGTHSIGIEAPLLTLQPLEAKITFDPQTKDLAVKAVCNAGCVSPVIVAFTTSSSGGGGEDNEGDHIGSRGENSHDENQGTTRTYSLSDSTGHTVKLQIFVENDGSELRARLLSIQYGNSAPITAAENELQFEFNKNLNQQISVEDVVSAEAHFNAERNVTTIHTETGGEDDHETEITNSGLWLLELTISNGSLNADFFQAQS